MLSRINKLDRDFLLWQFFSLVCPLTSHVTLFFSHQSLSACKDGGYLEEGLLNKSYLSMLCRSVSITYAGLTRDAQSTTYSLSKALRDFVGDL